MHYCSYEEVVQKMETRTPIFTIRNFWDAWRGLCKWYSQDILRAEGKQWVTFWTSLCKWKAEQKICSTLKRQTLWRATKIRKLWRIMIIYIMKGHGTKKITAAVIWQVTRIELLFFQSWDMKSNLFQYFASVHSVKFIAYIKAEL